MRRIVAALMGTVSGLVLLFSYHTSTNGQAATVAATDTAESQSSTTTPNADAGSSDSGSSASSESTAEESQDSGSTSSAGSAATSEPGSTSESASGTFTGDAVQTRFGDVQVEITVENGVITSSNAIQYPHRDRHDQQINSYAVPVLNAAAVAVQSADIDSVSGATFTSLAYAESLQSAIDQAFQ